MTDAWLKLQRLLAWASPVDQTESSIDVRRVRSPPTLAAPLCSNDLSLAEGWNQLFRNAV